MKALNKGSVTTDIDGKTASEGLYLEEYYSIYLLIVL